ncbi:MAG: hypothetical protein GEU81_18455 [Nitriliruptorales bacterium]|nr:hypothetical protein [Nitriliruptorales bacterium]
MTVSDHGRRRARLREPAALAAILRARPGLPPLRSIALVAVGGMAAPAMLHRRGRPERRR